MPNMEVFKMVINHHSLTGRKGSKMSAKIAWMEKCKGLEIINADLLEACKGLIFDLQEHWLPKELSETDYPITATHIKKAKQAISKAEGRDEK